MSDVILDSKEYQFESMADKYSQFFAPIFEISVNGSKISDDIAITDLRVETTIESKSESFSFQVTNAFELDKSEFKWLDTFNAGLTILIKTGYLDKLVPVFNGYITSVVCDFPDDGMPVIIVRGMDLSFLMMKGAKSNSWEKKKYSDVVSEIAKKHGAKTKVDATAEVIGTIAQNQIDDYHFIEHLAGIVNYDFFVVGKTLYFRKPLTEKTPVITLQWGQSLRSLTVDVNIAEQITGVTVRGWDPKEQKTVIGESGSIAKLGGNSKTGQDIMKTLGKYTEFVQANIDSKAEAEGKANALMNKRSMQLITGSGESIGIPEIRAGRYIKLAGVGKKLSQPYYIVSATHLIDKDGYVTRFQLEGNAI
ncbi:phage late control D family protein [Paenibacillus sp. MBLB4367]|uniref:phage late control D family protein n=1 Tax=Paenibacillus sp. MBLB4367 TaxID=3384767 RepID=UPI0039082220